MYPWLLVGPLHPATKSMNGGLSFYRKKHVGTARAPTCWRVDFHFFSAIAPAQSLSIRRTAECVGVSRR